MNYINSIVSLLAPEADTMSVSAYFKPSALNRLDSIFICNTSTSAQTYTIALSISNESIKPGECLYYENSIDENTTIVLNLSILFKEEKYLLLKSSGDITFTVLGSYGV
jgi:hypothetical protein